MVKYPLRTGTWSSRLGHKICGAIWILVLCVYTPHLVMFMLYSRDTIHFTYKDYSCDYDLTLNSPSWFILYAAVNFLLISILCYTTLLVSSTLLLVVAKRAASRHREALRWQGVTTVLLTVTVLLVSNFPISVVVVTQIIAHYSYSGTVTRAARYLTHLNIMSNFFVYSLTVKSFRDFLKEKIYLLLSSLRLISQPGLPPLQRPAGARVPVPAPVQGPAPLPPATELQALRSDQPAGQNVPNVQITAV